MKNVNIYCRIVTQILTTCLLLIATIGISHAATYNVGPAMGYLAKLSDVPWGMLKPGDIVNIHCTPGGYHEIIQISESGTAAQPIVIRGIPDNTGTLPIIDGANAVIDSHVDYRSSVFENLGVILVTPRKKTYAYGKTFPSYISIETLDIRNALYKADASISFTDQHGANRIYSTFACGIYIEFARHLTVRGCEISFNGNGIFANSKNQAAQSSADLLIEKNYLHDNGQPYIQGLSNGYAEHNIYIESDGAVYQYNRFGPLRPGCHGVMIKDRSAGTVIRYNEVTSTECSNIFAILDPQGGSGYIEFKPNYPDAYVYGNIITMQAGVSNGSSIIWFAACNGSSFYPTEHRGTLYYYNNTVINHQKGVAAFFLTDLPYTPTPNIYEKVDCRNNIFYTDTAINANIYQAFKMVITGANGVVNMGKNWISPKTTQLWLGHEGGSIVNGWANQLFGDANGVNNPGVADLVGGNYRLTTNSNSVDAADPLAFSALALGYDVTEEYLAPQDHQLRAILGLASDLGALEGTTAATSTNTNTTVPNVSGNVGSTISLYALLKTSTGNPVPNETLIFSIGAVVLGTALTDVNGIAKLTYKLPDSFGVGQQMLAVSFAGDVFYNASNGLGTLTFNQASTKTTVEPVAGKVGATVNLKSTLTRKTDNALLNGKTIRLQIDGVDVGFAVTTAGMVTLNYVIPNTLTVGAHTLKAVFDGDVSYIASTSSVGVFTVNP